MEQSIAFHYVTIGTAGRACLFGDVVEGKMVLSPAGQLVQREWLRMGFLHSALRNDRFVVMPNHLHALLQLDHAAGLPPLGALLAGFKAGCAVRINHLRGTPGGAVWQRQADERILRDDEMIEAIRRHIEENPRRWWERRRAAERVAGRVGGR